MTEHSKIPLPAPQGSAGEARSLIERAVRTFDLSSLAPPPVPANLAPAPVKPGLRHRAPEPAPASVPAVEAAPQPAVVSQPVPAAAEAAVAEPVAVEAAPADPAPAVQAPDVPAPVVQAPATFSAERHPVDRARLRDQGLIVPEGSVSGLFEEFRIVKRHLLLQAAELRRAGAGAAAQRVLIGSANPGDGKTYCALNLALAMAAEKESEVLLVDADFAKPSILSALGLPGGPGLMDALADPTLDVADCVLGTDIPGLWVLPAGEATTSDSEYLSSSRTAAVLARLSEGAANRIVIFDSPPALAASPAAELAKYVGQALVVVRADRTGQGAVEDAVKLLSACPNIQLLLNAVQFSPSGRRFGAYYGYGG
ncbi:MAG: capsular biosynthesis protein [Novosphingobium sp.]